MRVSPNHASRWSSSSRVTINRDLRRPTTGHTGIEAAASGRVVCPPKRGGTTYVRTRWCSTWSNFRNTLITNIGRVRSLPRTQVLRACCVVVGWLAVMVAVACVSDSRSPPRHCPAVIAFLRRDSHPSTATKTHDAVLNRRPYDCQCAQRGCHVKTGGFSGSTQVPSYHSLEKRKKKERKSKSGRRLKATRGDKLCAAR